MLFLEFAARQLNLKLSQKIFPKSRAYFLPPRTNMSVTLKKTLTKLTKHSGTFDINERNWCQKVHCVMVIKFGATRGGEAYVSSL